MDKLSDRLEFVAKDADFHGFHGNAALLREAAQLARRVEEAPVGDIWQHAYIDGQHTSRVRITRQLEDGLAIIGQRVRLVREE
ncbi:hypothetical protein [Pseudoxanthomonas beigongshangi]